MTDQKHRNVKSCVSFFLHCCKAYGFGDEFFPGKEAQLCCQGICLHWVTGCCNGHGHMKHWERRQGVCYSALVTLQHLLCAFLPCKAPAGPGFLLGDSLHQFPSAATPESPKCCKFTLSWLCNSSFACWVLLSGICNKNAFWISEEINFVDTQLHWDNVSKNSLKIIKHYITLGTDKTDRCAQKYP